MPDNQTPTSDVKPASLGKRGQKPCNRFELRLEEGVAQGNTLSEGKIVLWSEIWIDGQHLDEPHPIDLPLLVQSLHAPGWYEIFTCGCGIGGCAGIVEGIHVTHDAGSVRWFFRRPQSAGSLIDPALSEWEKTATPVTLTFDCAQMVNAIHVYLDAVRAVVRDDPGKFSWPVCGLSVQNMLKIDPNQPFYDIEQGA